VLKEGWTVVLVDVRHGGREGDKGTILAFANDQRTAAHIQWQTGSRKGEVTLTPLEEVVNPSERRKDG
jgi:hypothetical protein